MLKALTWFADGLYIVSSVAMVAGGLLILPFMTAQVFTLTIPFAAAICFAVLLVIGGLVAMGIGLYKEYTEQEEQYKNAQTYEQYYSTKNNQKVGENGTHYEIYDQEHSFLTLLRNWWQEISKTDTAKKKTGKSSAWSKLKNKISQGWERGRAMYSGFKNAHRIALMIPIVLVGLGLITTHFLSIPLGYLIIPVIGCFVLFSLSLVEGYVSQQRNDLRRAAYKINKKEIEDRWKEAVKKGADFRRKNLIDLKNSIIMVKSRYQSFDQLSASQMARCFLEGIVYGADGFYLVSSGLFLITLLSGVVLQTTSMGIPLAIMFLVTAIAMTYAGGYFSVNKEMKAQCDQEKWQTKLNFWKERFNEKNPQAYATSAEPADDNQESTPLTEAPADTFLKNNPRKIDFLSGSKRFIKFGRWARWIFCGLKNGHRSATGFLVALVAIGIFAGVNVGSLGMAVVVFPIVGALVMCLLTTISSALKEQREESIEDIKHQCKILQDQILSVQNQTSDEPSAAPGAKDRVTLVIDLKKAHHNSSQEMQDMPVDGPTKSSLSTSQLSTGPIVNS